MAAAIVAMPPTPPDATCTTMQSRTYAEPAAQLEATPSISAIATQALSKHNKSNDAVAALLTTQILGALQSTPRYTNDTSSLEIVASRVAANLVSAPATESETSTTRSVVRVIDDLLSGTRGVRINSNEAVLLISSHESDFDSESAAKKDIASSVRGATRFVLEELWGRGVVPARVYVRFVEDDEPSLTVLNVVNTDIGGPGMVDLLDKAFYGVGWRDELVVKEGWRGRDLVWRDEWFGAPSEQYGARSANVTSAPPAKDEEAAPILLSKSVTSEQILESGIDENVDDDCEKIETLPEYEDGDVDDMAAEHPDMAAWRERESSRAEINHPSWSRDDEPETLLDLINSQSSKLRGGNEPLSIISGGTSSHVGDANSRSEDDFEIIDKNA